MRRALAFVVAPLAAVGPMSIVLLLSLLTSGLSPGAPLASVLAVLVPYTLATMAVSYLYTWIAGMPAHYVLQRLGRTTLWDYVLAGVALTVLPAVLYFTYVVWYEASNSGVLTAVRRSAADAIRASLFFGSCGASVAAVSWLLNVEPRPG